MTAWRGSRASRSTPSRCRRHAFCSGGTLPGRSHVVRLGESWTTHTHGLRHLRDDAEVAFGVVESHTTRLGDRDDVLDPDPEPAGEVDARLHGEAHTRHERLLLTLDHVGRFVRGRADAVAGAVDEPLAVPCLDDHLPGGSVYLLTRNTWSDSIDARLLRLPN